MNTSWASLFVRYSKAWKRKGIESDLVKMATHTMHWHLSVPVPVACGILKKKDCKCSFSEEPFYFHQKWQFCLYTLYFANDRTIGEVTSDIMMTTLRFIYKTNQKFIWHLLKSEAWNCTINFHWRYFLRCAVCNEWKFWRDECHII